MTIAPEHIDRSFDSQIAAFSTLDVLDLNSVLTAWVHTANRSVVGGSVHTLALRLIRWLTDRIISLLS